MTTGAEASSASISGPAGFWRIRAIVQTVQRHGPWAGFRLFLMFTHGCLRRLFGRYQRPLIALWYLGLFTSGVAMLFALRQGLGEPQIEAGNLWQVLTALATGVSMVFIPLGKVCLSKEFQQQLWFYCLGAWIFAALLSATTYVFFDPWGAFYERSPATATLVAVGGGGVLIGFRTAIGWFVRGMLKPAYVVSDPAEMAGLSEIGRHRVCIHEAGHALCYGLAEGIPEDASVGVDTDSFNIMAGVVTLPQPRDLTAISRSLLEWHMLMLMAGGAAERHFLGEESICGAGDQETFMKTAVQYMLAGYGDVFTLEAKDVAEVEANRNAIRRLRDLYSERAFEFISANSDLCSQLAQLIEQREYLGCEELAAFDLKVTPPQDNWPLRWPEGISLYKKVRENASV